MNGPAQADAGPVNVRRTAGVGDLIGWRG